MPYELDTVTLEEDLDSGSYVADSTRPAVGATVAAADGDRHVCCLADCGPACDFPISAVCSGVTGCRPFDCLATVAWAPVGAAKRLTQAEEAQPLCCASSTTCDCVSAGGRRHRKHSLISGARAPDPATR